MLMLGGLGDTTKRIRQRLPKASAALVPNTVLTVLLGF